MVLMVVGCRGEQLISDQLAVCLCSQPDVESLQLTCLPVSHTCVGTPSHFSTLQQLHAPHELPPPPPHPHHISAANHFASACMQAKGLPACHNLTFKVPGALMSTSIWPSRSRKERLPAPSAMPVILERLATACSYRFLALFSSSEGAGACACSIHHDDCSGRFMQSSGANAPHAWLLVDSSMHFSAASFCLQIGASIAPSACLAAWEQR